MQPGNTCVQKVWGPSEAQQNAAKRHCSPVGRHLCLSLSRQTKDVSVSGTVRVRAVVEATLYTSVICISTTMSGAVNRLFFGDFWSGVFGHRWWTDFSKSKGCGVKAHLLKVIVEIRSYPSYDSINNCPKVFNISGRKIRIMKGGTRKWAKTFVRVCRLYSGITRIFGPKFLGFHSKCDKRCNEKTRLVTAGPSSRVVTAGPSSRVVTAGPSRVVTAGPSSRVVTAGPSSRV
eukprot:1192034-Prorocentrum_minimum.AAC.4